jgi:hypothetical protein
MCASCLISKVDADRPRLMGALRRLMARSLVYAQVHRCALCGEVGLAVLRPPLTDSRQLGTLGHSPARDAIPRQGGPHVVEGDSTLQQEQFEHGLAETRVSGSQGGAHLREPVGH